MSLSTEAALATLQDTAGSAQDPGLERRLVEIQQVVGDDLGWVEAELSRAVTEGVEPATNAARHLIVRGGKRVRPLALLLSAACFDSIPPAAREMAVVVELIHSATLLHDDVIDSGTERRGVVAARLLWGNAVSILSGDLLLVHALQRTQQHAPALMPPLLSTLRTLVDGEIVQLRGRKALDSSETTYERILRDKTASLFRFSARAGAELGGASPESCQVLAEFGEALGVAFQLVDDILDYVGEDTGKTLLADLCEGKMTLPLVLAIAEEPSLLAQVEQVRAGQGELVGEIRSRVVTLGVCDEVRRRARSYTTRAVRALERIPDCPARSLLEAVARELSQRTH